MADVELKTFDVLRAIEGGVEQYIGTLALRIEGAAKDNLKVGYGVDTGAMQQSISAITSRESHYAANVAAAAEMNPEARFAPEIQLVDALEAVVQVPVHYAGLVELGTVRMAAQPFMTPAVEIVAVHAEYIAREVAGLNI